MVLELLIVAALTIFGLACILVPVQYRTVQHANVSLALSERKLGFRPEQLEYG